MTVQLSFSKAQQPKNRSCQQFLELRGIPGTTTARPYQDFVYNLTQGLAEERKARSIPCKAVFAETWPFPVKSVATKHFVFLLPLEQGFF